MTADSTVPCPSDDCSREFERLGKHWYSSPSHRPDITEHQHEVITGLVMGDGSVSRQSKNAHIDVQMTNRKYLEYLDDLFGCLTTGVKLAKTAEEVAKASSADDFNEYDDPDAYADLYRLRTRNHPALNVYDSWYETGEKVWPSSIELTPTVLKHWYVGDGTYDEREFANSSTIAFSVVNESRNQEKVDALFDEVGLPTPSWYPYECESGRMTCRISWNCEESVELFEYMGAPLPGFQYKWTDEITYDWGDL